MARVLVLGLYIIYSEQSFGKLKGTLDDERNWWFLIICMQKQDWKMGFGNIFLYTWGDKAVVQAIVYSSSSSNK